MSASNSDRVQYLNRVERGQRGLKPRWRRLPVDSRLPPDPAFEASKRQQAVAIRTMTESSVESRHGPALSTRDVFCPESARGNSILHVVQMARIFPDSKTFVDMKLKHSPDHIFQAFRELIAPAAGLVTSPSNLSVSGRSDSSDSSREDVSSNTYEEPLKTSEISKVDIANFVKANFTLENQMVAFTPSDWTPSPRLLLRLDDPMLGKFVKSLNVRWKTLCRKIQDDVQLRPEIYSLLYLPHPVVIPGGRFREIYYWDSFWIIRGLIVCEMLSTVKGMLLNFVHLIGRLGFVPNGGRTYYECRSQPPLFIQMVNEYVKASGDVDFVRDNINYMANEFEYWMQNHLVNVIKDGAVYTLARYNCEEAGPRPESYFEDFELVEGLSLSPSEKEQMYFEIKTGAETGWDFSTRWMVKPADSKEVNANEKLNAQANSFGDDLKDTKARFIIPVDLNAILAANARKLSQYYREIIGDFEAAIKYEHIAQNMCEAMDAVLWNCRDGVWYDYDLINQAPRVAFFPSNLTPLWAECFSSESKRAEQTVQAVDYLHHFLTKSDGSDAFAGGVPTSLSFSGQQWDFPNCWPPLEHLLVMGLEKTDANKARELAFRIARTRIRGALANFKSRGHMFEKYDATSPEEVGGGGEYDVQLGFGWSNGVVLDFIDLYHERLSTFSQNEIFEGYQHNEIDDVTL